jgi:Na+-driven multidrug efflux pump
VLAAYLGQNIGNQNVRRARETFRKAMLLSVSMMVLGSLLIMPFRTLFASFFIKDSPETLALTVEYMFYLLVGLPLMAIFQTFIGTFNGTGNTKFTFMITISRLWILRIPIIFAFKTWTTLGSSGVWYAMLLSNLLISVMAWILYQRVDYQPKIDIRKNQESAA